MNGQNRITGTGGVAGLGGGDSQPPQDFRPGWRTPDAPGQALTSSAMDGIPRRAKRLLEDRTTRGRFPNQHRGYTSGPPSFPAGFRLIPLRDRRRRVGQVRCLSF